MSSTAYSLSGLEYLPRLSAIEHEVFDEADSDALTELLRRAVNDNR